MSDEARTVEEEFPVVHDSEVLPAKRDDERFALQKDASVTDLLSKADVIRDAMSRAMKPDVHYGVIPGTAKPTLLKKGAEKLCTLFHLRPHYEELGSVHRDNLIGYRYRCVLTHFPTGLEIAEGVGSCNSREKKYRRSDPWDIDNTIVKMACKRALISAILVGTASSDIFAEKPEQTRGQLSAILNGRAVDYDSQYPRQDGKTWQDWTREKAGELWGYESRAECSDEELEELITLMDVDIFGKKAA